MIYEESCDTENWSNGCWKFTGINYILKYIIINYISQYYCAFTFLLKEWSIGEH